MHRTSVLLLALALASAAPLAAQGVPEGTPGCSPAEEARLRRLSPAEDRRDSLRAALWTAVRQDVLDSARAAGVGAPQGALLVLLNARRADGRIRLLRGNVPDSVVQAVAPRAVQRLREWPGRGDVRFAARLDTLPAPAPGPRPDWESARLRCEPFLLERDREAITRRVSDLAATSVSFTLPNPRLSTRLRMLVDREGRVAYAELERRSGMPGVDDLLLELAPSLRFRPALADGTPLDSWVTLPLDVEFASRRQPRDPAERIRSRP